MKLKSLFFASFLAWIPLQGHAQNLVGNSSGYTYFVVSSDTVKVPYNQFTSISLASNQDFNVKSNEEWINAQKVSGSSIVVFCKENTESGQRLGSLTLSSLDGATTRNIVVVQEEKEAINGIPENKEIISPVMGWNTSKKNTPVTEEYIQQQTAKLKELGLKAAGYHYVIFDNTTFASRGADGQLLTADTQFPQGLKSTLENLRQADYKAGLQTNSGTDLGENFGKGLGMKGNEEKDCNYLFNNLGLDYLQVDFAQADKDEMSLIHQSIQGTNKKDVHFNVNSNAFPGTWIASIANSWHTAAPFLATWESVKSIINENLYLSAYPQNGQYQDLDVLHLDGSLTAEQEKTHFGLWCMLNSPLVISGDVSALSARALALLNNKELIDLNQNATSQKAYVAQYTNGCYVWVKDVNRNLKNSRAIAVYNPTDAPQDIVVSMDNVDLAGRVSVHDVFTHKNLSDVTDFLSVQVPAHGTRIYLLNAESRLERHIYEAETGYVAAFQNVDNTAKSSAKYLQDYRCSGNAKVAGLGNSKENSLEWKNVESNNGGLYQMTVTYFAENDTEVTIEVNQTPVKTMKVAGCAGLRLASFTFNVELQKGNNTVKLINTNGNMPEIDVMKMHPCTSSQLFVEAENFNKKGGWKVDQQFMDLMGSPYINAHGMGVPVEDAVTEVEIPASNTYHIYARTFNWVSPWTTKEGPGKFQVGIDGKRMETVLGATGNKWEWQYVGALSLSEGKHELAIHDLTGFNGRVDAIFFNSEKVAPPSDITELGKFRRSQLNMPNTPEVQQEFDLVVCGGGIAGMCAAMAAARQGMKVALINDRPVLGGNNSAEVRVHLGGRIEVPPYTNLGNLIKEFGHTKPGNAQPEANYEDGKKLEWIRSEKNIRLFLNNRVNQVHVADDQIDYVISQNTETGVRTLYKAPLFVDCTGDGTIGALAGADFRMGREARSEFDETKGPDTPDSMTMGTSNQWYAVTTSSPSPFPVFEYGVDFNESNCEAITKGDWNWEGGMHQNQLTDFERIRDYGLIVVYSNWSFLKNKYSKKANFANKRLEWLAYIGGKRESRRLMGDYILNGNDIVNHNVQPDFTAGTSWTIDIHYPIPANEAAFNGEAFKSFADHVEAYSYPVPYRCLYSRNVNNLFMAGRNISVSHMALGTVRVMRTTGMLGEVVGLAASVCKKHDVLPREVYKTYFNDLKELMKKGAGRQGLPNNQKFNQGRWLND